MLTSQSGEIYCKKLSASYQWDDVLGKTTWVLMGATALYLYFSRSPVGASQQLLTTINSYWQLSTVTGNDKQLQATANNCWQAARRHMTFCANNTCQWLMPRWLMTLIRVKLLLFIIYGSLLFFLNFEHYIIIIFLLEWTCQRHNSFFALVIEVQKTMHKSLWN